jgi:hypothetical protein
MCVWICRRRLNYSLDTKFKCFAVLHFIDIFVIFGIFVFKYVFFKPPCCKEFRIMKTEINTLTPRHQQIARLLFTGHTQTEVARMIGCNKSTVCRLQRDPLVQQELSRLQESADAKVIEVVPGMIDRLEVGAMRGMDVLIDILNDPSDTVDMMKLKANVALELLSRTGYGPVKQIQIDKRSVSTHLTHEDIEEFKRRGIAAACEAGKVIECDSANDIS